jgi:uncharacterized protein YqeY
VSAVPLPERLRADLTQARRVRDRAATSALRTALAALANAEAPAFDAASHREGRGELVEHERLVLSAADHRSVLEGEIARREQLLAETAGTGVDRSYTADLEAELAVLRRYLD